MKALDMIKLSNKTLRGRWAVLPMFAMVFAAFCLCFAGAIWTTVGEEKAQPYELILMPDENRTITEEDMIKLSDLQGVTAVSPAYFISVLMETGAYSAQLTLTGIDGGYVGGESFIEGTIYPESSAMPYIVLNEAARMEFSNPDSEPSREGKAPEIDWLDADFSITLPEIREIASKVCGILVSDVTSDGGNQMEDIQNPTAYISLGTARNLLQKSGQSTGYMAAYVRVVNIGQADKVSKEIAALGLSVSNSSEELQIRWDALTRERYYLMVMGMFFLICATVLTSARCRISLLEERQSWIMLQWMGMKGRNIRRIFSLQGFMVSVAGWTLGSIIALSLPSFLLSENLVMSTFTLPIPPWVIVASFLFCTVAGQFYRYPGDPI